MPTWLVDLRHALRLLAKAPGFTLAALLSLGLGIGANVTASTWMRQVVLEPLPGVKDAGRLVALDQTGLGVREGISYPDFKDYRDESGAFQGVFAGQQKELGLERTQGAVRVWAWYGTGGMFEVLGTRARLGRCFTPEDDRAGAPLVAVLSTVGWMRHFGGDPGVVGRSLRIGGRDAQVVGVTEPGFLGPVGGLSYDVFLPLEPFIGGGGDPETSLTLRSAASCYVMGRLAPGLGLVEARDRLLRTHRTLAQRHPAEHQNTRLRVARLHDIPMGAPQVLAQPLALLLAGVAFILLMACVNVAGLLLSRALARQRELALRSAVGATRGRVLRQLLTEGLVLGLGAGLTGWGLSFASLQLFRSALPPTDLPLAFPLAMDRSAFVTALLLAVGTTLVFALVPAFRATAEAPAAVLKAGGARGGGAPGHRRLQAALVVLGSALALVLLVGAGLMTRSALALRHGNPGFQPRGLVQLDLGLELAGLDAPKARQTALDLMDRLAALPGVEGVTSSEGCLLGYQGPKGVGAWWEGRPLEERITLHRNLVGPDFCRLFRIPLREGRDLLRSDDAGSEPVAVVNETLAARMRPGGSVVGTRIRINGHWRTIVGVCRDFKFQTWNEPAGLFVLLPVAQSDLPSWNLVVRTDRAPAALMPGLRRTVAAAAPTLPVRLLDLERVAQGAGFLVRTTGALLGGLSLLALFLAALGLYALQAHAVAQRTRELGLRLALGASPRGILGGVVLQGLRLAGLGVALGLGPALWLAGQMAPLLHRTSPRDPAVLLGAPCLMFLVAVLATFLPAFRAARVQPAVALRSE